MRSAIERLEAWYLARCDGEWEHSCGVEIGTIDNPGWWIKIDLAGTGLEGVAFARRVDGEGDESYDEAGIRLGRG